MKKILLINPAFNIAKAKYDTSMSVGISCLSSYLAEKGVEVTIVDAARQKDYRQLIEKALSQVNCVGLSVMTSQIASALDLSKMIKSQNRNTKIIWGGFHPTFFPEQVVEHNLVDVAVLHEGEETLLELVDYFCEPNNSVSLKDISGIAFLNEKNEAEITSRRPFINFEDLPLPRWDLIPREVLENLEIVPTHTSRGCPHRCTFCVNAITKNRWRWRTSAKVIEDLDVISQKSYFQGKPVRFWDENFFVNTVRSKEIIAEMTARNFGIKWETTVRADYINDRMLDDEMMSDMKKSGCYLLSFGAESGSDTILKKLEKGITRDNITRSAEQCLKYDIIPQYSFMVGLPGEKPKDIRDTVSVISDLVKLSPNIQILGPQAFRPYPGSKLYEECLESGWQEPQSLEEWAKVMEDQLNYLSPWQFPWLKNPGLVESLEAYTRFGAHSIKNAMGSTVKVNRLLKFFFVLFCKLRWKLKFFHLPWDFYLARKYINLSSESNH